MENIDIAAISDFLLSINHAVTTITISCAGHACIFYTILAGIIGLAILTFLPLKVRKYIAERRYRQYILYIIFIFSQYILYLILYFFYSILYNSKKWL